MNHYFSEWNIEADLPGASHRKPLRLDQELVELLWENGQVVLNNQTHKYPGIGPKCHQSSTHVEDSSAVNLQNLVQDNDPVSWNHCQVDDPFEKELSSFLLPELHPITNSALIHDAPIGQLDSYKFCNIDGSQISNLCANTSQPSRGQALNHVQVQPHANLGDVVGINKRAHNNLSPTSNGAGFGGSGAGCMKMRDVRENSVKTVGSSHCGSNQVMYDADISLASCSGIGREIPNTEDNYAGKVASQSERSTERETVASLSSGGSGFTSIGGTCNQSTGTYSNKRKGRETENSESQSEAALLESDTRKKSAQKSVTTRKCRASEVHNLSERRRRDRINEKMRALQELLPRSNQSDKASMLDDAIQYMKSLQMQLQMMWVGSQMAPMMFPGVPPYMSRLEMGISPPMMSTSLQSAMNLSRLPMMDQARAAVASMPNQAGICQPTLLNCMNYQNQMQNCNFSDQYGNYIGFYPVQSANQQMNMFPYGPNMTQQNHTLPTPGGDGNGGPH